MTVSKEIVNKKDRTKYTLRITDVNNGGNKRVRIYTTTLVRIVRTARVNEIIANQINRNNSYVAKMFTGAKNTPFT